ncbi:MAG: minor capsid protein, partial [Phaeospirillum sp.]|nr:minor capsid protein [Phaeospirillum sp.]
TLTWGEGDEDWMREQLQLPGRQEPRPARMEPAQKPLVGSGARAPEDERRMARGERRELIVLADPPSFREEPSYPEFAVVVEDFSAAVRGLGERFRAQVWRLTGLPEVDREQARFKAEVAFPPLTAAQRKELDTAIESFLTDFFGDKLTLAGFVEIDTEDALLQGFLRLSHAVGVQRARRLTQAEETAFRPTRESPQIKRLLTDSFNRLSAQGEVRLRGQLGEVRDILTDGALKGRNSFDVAKELDQRFEQYSRYEFERLARTEASFANNAGIVDELSAEGVKVFEVLVSPLACPVCQGHAGAKVPASKAQVGETIPPFHPLCLCSTVAHVESLFSSSEAQRFAYSKALAGADADFVDDD